jgi:DnaJ-class molecular chaperone
MSDHQQASIMGLHEAFLLFRRLGVDVPSLSQREFAVAYFDLAKRNHPDIGNRSTEHLMAKINAARTIILRSH